MKVELSIADDRELKEHIRDVIKGQVLSIARGEIKDIIAQAVSEKAIPSRVSDIEKIVRDVIIDEVKRQLGASHYSAGSWIKREAQKRIAELIKKWAASEYIQQL